MRLWVSRSHHLFIITGILRTVQILISWIQLKHDDKTNIQNKQWILPGPICVYFSRRCMKNDNVARKLSRVWCQAALAGVIVPFLWNHCNPWEDELRENRILRDSSQGDMPNILNSAKSRCLLLIIYSRQISCRLAFFRFVVVVTLGCDGIVQYTMPEMSISVNETCQIW